MARPRQYDYNHQKENKMETTKKQWVMIVNYTDEDTIRVGLGLLGEEEPYCDVNSPFGRELLTTGKISIEEYTKAGLMEDLVGQRIRDRKRGCHLRYECSLLLRNKNIKKEDLDILEAKLLRIPEHEVSLLTAFKEEIIPAYIEDECSRLVTRESVKRHAERLAKM